MMGLCKREREREGEKKQCTSVCVLRCERTRKQPQFYAACRQVREGNGVVLSNGVLYCVRQLIWKMTKGFGKRKRKVTPPVIRT